MLSISLIVPYTIRLLVEERWKMIGFDEFVSVEHILFYIKYGTHDWGLINLWFWDIFSFVSTWNSFVLAKFVGCIGPRSQGNQFSVLRTKVRFRITISWLKNENPKKRSLPHETSQEMEHLLTRKTSSKYYQWRMSWLYWFTLKAFHF